MHGVQLEISKNGPLAPTATFPVIGIQAQNSIAFVQSVFECLAQDLPVVVFKEPADQSRAAGYQVERMITPPVETGWAKLSFTPRKSPAIAQIAFTSGTEGEPKGIFVSHTNLADMVERLNSVMHMDASIREYVGVPVYHSFGFGRCRAVATLGGAFYIPPDGFNPLELQALLAADEINAISAVPSLWRALFDCEDIFGEETRRVKWIEIGSQYMSAEEKLRLKRLFPDAIIVQHYGLTEASRATFLEIHQETDPAVLESVGRVVGDTEIKITEQGLIAIRGSVVAQQCMKGGQRLDLVDPKGWLVTSDLGELNQGYLTFRGRADDIINCAGVKISPDNLERRLRERLGLKQGLACCRIVDERRGDGILLACVSGLPVGRAQLEQAAVEVLAQLQIHAGNALKFLEVKEFPLTATGKVRRKDLANLYSFEEAQRRESQLAPGPGLGLELSAREQQLVDLWKQLLNVPSIGVNESFLDLGGDSLTAITAMVKMKRLGIPEQTCRGILQGKTIAEIVADEQAETPPSSAQPNLSTPAAQGAKDALNIKFMRGVLVLMVIAAHWAGGLFDRMPESLQWLWAPLAPVFSFGTPGFAILYGVAMGYSLYPLFCKSPERVKSMLGPIFWVIFSGVLLLALTSMLLQYVEYGPLNITQVANSFYSVLSFYLLATLTLYFWFWYLKKSGAPVITALATAVLAHLFYLLYMEPLTTVPAEGFVELAKILVAAKYSYFNMACGVFLGLAVGIAMTDPKAFRLANPVALLLGTFAVVGAWWWSDYTGNLAQWLVWPDRMVQGWKWLFYIGVILLAMVGMDRVLNHYHTMPALLAKGVNVIACLGFLAFPMFVSHELVLPIKNLLEVGGLANGLAVLMSLGLFAAFSGLLIYKSYRLQFN